MAMPDDLILIRHGESEANIVQDINSGKIDAEKEIADDYPKHHDKTIRLTKRGIRQANSVGKWLKANDLLELNRYYVSPFTRTLETAANLMIDGHWRIDDRLRERSWGEYNLLSWDQIQEDNPFSFKVREHNQWYWRPHGGETLAGEVRERFESFLTTLHRKATNERVIAVSHGGWMQTARFVLERLTPDEWISQVTTKEYKLWNCQTLHYTRINPNTGEKAPYLKWRRSICPWDEKRSWNNGEWVEINSKQYSDVELKEEVAKYKQLLPKELLED